MSHDNRSLIVALVAIAAACAHSHQPSASNVSDEGVSWTAFHWVTATIGGTTFDRAALLVPITADTLGGTFWLQLDTGADSDIWLYTAPLAQLLDRHGAVRDTTTWFEIPTGRIGTYVLSDHAVNIRRLAGDTIQWNDPYPKIGTLGLNFFRTRVLLIDFPAERFAILDGATSLPNWIEEQASWVPLDFRNDKAFLPLTLAGETHSDFFYDTGASLFPVSTTRAIWERATGRQGSEPENMVWTVSSFGQEVTLIGAPAKGLVAMGQARLRNPLIYFLAEGPEELRPENWGFQASGLIGNVLFADRYLVVLDVPRRRFGLVARPE